MRRTRYWVLEKDLKSGNVHTVACSSFFVARYGLRPAPTCPHRRAHAAPSLLLAQSVPLYVLTEEEGCMWQRTGSVVPGRVGREERRPDARTMGGRGGQAFQIGRAIEGVVQLDVRYLCDCMDRAAGVKYA